MAWFSRLSLLRASSAIRGALCGVNAESIETKLKPRAQVVKSEFAQHQAPHGKGLLHPAEHPSSLLAPDCLDRQQGDKTQPLNRECPAHFSGVIAAVCPHRKANPNGWNEGA